MEYYAVCKSCGIVFTVNKGPLWWRAKQAAESGRLDAISVSGVECGCKRPLANPKAPYRVFGFTDEGREFNSPFDSFIAAVKAFREEDGFGGTVFIEGVSPAVKDRLQYGC